MKAKRAAKPSAAKKAGVKSKKPAVRAAVAVAAKATPYTPAPLKGDGWPPFRYPVH